MKRIKRLTALFTALSMLFACAFAEEFTEYDYFTGEVTQDSFTDDAGVETGDDTPQEYTEYTYDDQYQTDYDGMYYQPYVPQTINTDAEVKLGYVASGSANINPLYCTERDLVSLNQLVFESVVALDDTFKPTPELADSWNVEGKTWVFNLRQGIMFHNGAELTAADVYLTWQRFLYDGLNSPYYSRMSMIENMVVKSTYQLEVTAKFSGYITLYAMTFPVMQSSTLGDAMARGTGPYWYTEYAQGVGVRLEMNPLWWRTDARIGSIAAIAYADSAQLLTALQTDEIDMMYTRSNRASLYRKLANLTGMDYTTNTFEVMIPNLGADSVMGDLRMRQAVMYAIDRAAIAENAYGGMGIQCEVPINPGSWLYESQSAMYYYSPERALQLIYDCGWKDLTGDGMMNKVDGVRLQDLTIKIITYNEPTNSIRENACHIIADYLKTIGIDAKVYAYSKEKCASKIKSKDYDIALIGVEVSDVPNLSPLLSSKGEMNLNRYNNDDMDSLLSQITSASTDDALKSIYSQIQLTLVNRLPIMGLLFRTGTILSRRSLSGLHGMRESNTLNGFERMEPSVS